LSRKEEFFYKIKGCPERPLLAVIFGQPSGLMDKGSLFFNEGHRLVALGAGLGFAARVLFGTAVGAFPYGHRSLL
jgi:hypothetical protein